MINVQTLKNQNPLLPLIEGDLGAGKKSGAWVMFRCPFHDDKTPSLGVREERFKCFGCDAKGDVIAYVMKRHNLGFRAACEQLGAGNLPQAPAHQHETAPKDAPPPDEWQIRALRVVAAAHERLLYAQEAARARAYLAGRGIGWDTWGTVWLGFVTGRDYRHINGLNVPGGILIPWGTDGELWLANVRRPSNKPGEKYRRIAGGASGALYAPWPWVKGRPILLTEGEFDAMVAWQAVGDLCNVGTFGSASNAGIPARWLPRFATAPVILVATDPDMAGNRAAARFGMLSARVRRVVLPAGQDVSDFVVNGGDFRALVKRSLQENGARKDTRGPDQAHAHRKAAQQMTLLNVSGHHYAYE